MEALFSYVQSDITIAEDERQTFVRGRCGRFKTFTSPQSFSSFLQTSFLPVSSAVAACCFHALLKAVIQAMKVRVAHLVQLLVLWGTYDFAAMG